MKRYLITITGRANLGYKGNRLRERDLCYSYVYGKNKAEAISKFWEQIEKSSGLKGFERRDFKITAERWEKDSFLDVNGNVVTDIEWAIPFDLLASVEMVHDEHFKNYKLAVPESIMAQAELEEMKSCMIKSLDEMQEDLNRAEASEEADQAEAEAIQNGKIINPEKKYHVISWKIGAPVDEKTDCGIWDGSGMAHFSEGFGGFTYSADGWLYFAQEAEDEITAEPDQETAQESNSEAQMSMREIANINNLTEFYNLETDSIRFPDNYFENTEIFVFRMMRENPDLIMRTEYDFQNARWIHIEKKSQPESSQESSSDNSKEIIKETAEESTESNSKPHSQPVHHLNGAPRLINDSSDDQLASLKEKRKQLAIKQHHILERYGNNQESQSIFKEITEIDSQIKKIEFKIGAVVRVVDLDSSFYGEWGIIKKFDGSFYYLAMHGDEHGLLLIMKEEQIEMLSLESRMKTLTDFRAQAQETLNQAEEIMLKLRNTIDALDDQIARLFIKGAEMKSEKEAE